MILSIDVQILQYGDLLSYHVPLISHHLMQPLLCLVFCDLIFDYLSLNYQNCSNYLISISQQSLILLIKQPFQLLTLVKPFSFYDVLIQSYLSWNYLSYLSYSSYSSYQIFYPYVFLSFFRLVKQPLQLPKKEPPFFYHDLVQNRFSQNYLNYLTSLLNDVFYLT